MKRISLFFSILVIGVALSSLLIAGCSQNDDNNYSIGIGSLLIKIVDSTEDQAPATAQAGKITVPVAAKAQYNRIVLKCYLLRRDNGSLNAAIKTPEPAYSFDTAISPEQTQVQFDNIAASYRYWVEGKLYGASGEGIEPTADLAFSAQVLIPRDSSATVTVTATASPSPSPSPSYAPAGKVATVNESTPDVFSPYGLGLAGSADAPLFASFINFNDKDVAGGANSPDYGFAARYSSDMTPVLLEKNNEPQAAETPHQNILQSSSATNGNYETGAFLVKDGLDFILLSASRQKTQDWLPYWISKTISISGVNTDSFELAHFDSVINNKHLLHAATFINKNINEENRFYLLRNILSKNADATLPNDYINDNHLVIDVSLPPHCSASLAGNAQQLYPLVYGSNQEGIIRINLGYCNASNDSQLTLKKLLDVAIVERKDSMSYIPLHIAIADSKLAIVWANGGQVFLRRYSFEPDNWTGTIKPLEDTICIYSGEAVPAKYEPRVAIDNSGRCAIVWTALIGTPAKNAVLGRTVKANGELNDAFIIDQSTTADIRMVAASVAMSALANGDGRFVVGWSSIQANSGKQSSLIRNYPIEYGECQEDQLQ